MQYDCAKCSGSGRLLHYGHVMNGLCFACKGHGKVSKKPAKPSVKWKCFYECADGSVKCFGYRNAPSEKQARTKAVADFNKRKHAPFFVDAMGAETISVELCINNGFE